MMSSSQKSGIIYIGRKPTMSYVLAVITSFAAPHTEEVILKARERVTSTAVDVTEIARRRFMKELKIGKITLGTEEVSQKEDGTRMEYGLEIYQWVEGYAQDMGGKRMTLNSDEQSEGFWMKMGFKPNRRETWLRS